MSQGDRTGPMGQGPRSGRALGFCSGSDTPGYTKDSRGRRGRGFGYGKGQRRGNNFNRVRNTD